MDTKMLRRWGLEPGVNFCNHGSFGASPTAVLEHQQRLRQHLESQPVRFFIREMQPLLDRCREQLAEFVGAAPADLVFVNNATEGVNAVLRSIDWQPGDTILVTEHGYPACSNAANFVARRYGAKVKVVPMGWPGLDEASVTRAVVDAVDDSVRLALLDHVTSASGLVLPIKRLVAELAQRGVDTLVDGAHAPGMVALDIDDIGAAYYTGNCHKWLCAPKGAAFLVVQAKLQQDIYPTTISHGFTAEGASRFHRMFDWTGTSDPTAVLSIGAAIEVMDAMVEGGWPALRERNRTLALQGRDILAAALGVPPPCPDTMIGSLATLPLPHGRPLDLSASKPTFPLQDELWFEHRIEVPVGVCPGYDGRIVRISAQLYNTVDDYRRLAETLVDLLPHDRSDA